MRQQLMEMWEISMVNWSIIIDGVANPKKGVVVIVKDVKIQSMMPSDFKSFNKLQ